MRTFAEIRTEQRTVEFSITEEVYYTVEFRPTWQMGVVEINTVDVQTLTAFLRANNLGREIPYIKRVVVSKTENPVSVPGRNFRAPTRQDVEDWQRYLNDGSKIEAIKAVRMLTGLGLKESKDIIDHLVGLGEGYGREVFISRLVVGDYRTR